MISRRQFFKVSAATGMGLAVGGRMGIWNVRPGFAQGVVQGPPLPGNKIPQFIDPLPDQYNGELHVLAAGATQIVLSMEEFLSPVMPTGFVPANGTYLGTWKWGYREAGQTASSYIGPILLATRDIPSNIKFVNNLPSTPTNIPAWDTSTDQTLHWANPNNLPMNHPDRLVNYAGPVPAVVHLHGGEVPSQLDGGPDAWFLSQTASGYTPHGHAYYSYDDPSNTGTNNWAIYRYPNTQEGANIWFHDHALGITRLNVYAGMAGAYIIDEPGLWAPQQPKPGLIPLVIQDRMFDVNGQLFFPNIGLNPEHPFWVPEFVGDTIVVNGKVWPFKAVDRQRYTLLFLNGSNARFYDMFFIDPVSGVKGPPMYVISTDGGYLDNPVLIDPNATGRQTKAGIAKSLIVGPGERYEAIVDFNDATWLANLTAFYGTLPATVSLHLRNNARTPFPGGAPAPNSTTGRIMEFRVSANAPTDNSFNPAGLAALRTRPIVRLVDPVAGAPAAGVTPVVKRQLTLNEVMGPGGPLEVLVNNTKWSGESARNDPTDPNAYKDFYYDAASDTYYSELPKEGDTEQWEIINLTADAHPIHLHLVQFQLMNRQRFDVGGYTAAYNAAFPGIAGDPVGGMFIPAFGPPLDYNATNGDGAVGGNPAIGPFLNAKKWPAVPPLPSEAGWKDTVIMYPGEVTRIIVRWAPTDVAVGDTANEHFPFDPDGGHGFVWHCHIIDHEDNEMMRPDLVVPKGGTIGNVSNPGPAPTRSVVQGTDY
jgi:spore coat protein A